MVMLILKLGNIRLASLFYWDPESFPAKPFAVQSTEHLIATVTLLLYPRVISVSRFGVTWLLVLLFHMLLEAIIMW
ncbi:hypothetical protein V1507DRAFT_470008 [Lipomyces tetrasporus]